MFEPVNEIAVFTSTILALAIGSIWYSPLLFGDHWMRAARLSEAQLEATKDKLFRMVVLAVVANGVTLYIVAQLLVLGSGTFGSVGALALLLALLHGSVLANATIWEQKPISYLLINFGYAAVVIFVGATVITFWPW